MAEHQLPKLTVGVRFPSPAPLQRPRSEPLRDGRGFTRFGPRARYVPDGSALSAVTEALADSASSPCRRRGREAAPPATRSRPPRRARSARAPPKVALTRRGRLPLHPWAHRCALRPSGEVELVGVSTIPTMGWNVRRCSIGQDASRSPPRVSRAAAAARPSPASTIPPGSSQANESGTNRCRQSIRTRFWSSMTTAIVTR